MSPSISSDQRQPVSLPTLVPGVQAPAIGAIVFATACAALLCVAVGEEVSASSCIQIFSGTPTTHPCPGWAQGDYHLAGTFMGHPVRTCGSPYFCEG